MAVLGYSAHGVEAKMIRQIRQPGIASAVITRITTSAAGPGVKLSAGGAKISSLDPAGVITIQHLGQDTVTLIQPQILVRQGVLVNDMLKFVRQRRQIN